MKRGNTERQAMTMYETKLTDKQWIKEKICVVTKHAVILPPCHISIMLFTPINYSGTTQTGTLLEMEEIPFFSIEQPNIIIISALQKPDNRAPDKFIAIL